MFKFGLINLKFRKIAFFSYSLFSAFTIASRLIQSNSSFIHFSRSLLIGVIATGVTLPMLWLVCTANQKFGLGRKNISYPFLLIALVGGTRGLILQGLIASFGLKTRTTTISGILLSATMTLIFFLVPSSFIEASLQKREKFNQIFSKATQLLAHPGPEINQSVDHKDLYQITLDEIKNSVKSVGLVEDKLDREVLLETSKVIQDEINEVLRPLSHRLWVNAMGQVKHRRLFRILKDAIENLDFNIWLILIYQLTIGGYGIFLVLGLETSIVVTSLSLFISISLIQSYFYFQSKTRENRLVLGLSFLVLEALLPVIFPLVIRNPEHLVANLVAGLLISPTLPALILVASAYRLITRDNTVAIEAASSVIYRINSIPTEIKSTKTGIELAEYLHNSLQSELFGIAKRLEAAAHGGINADPSDTLKLLDAALNRDFLDALDRGILGIRRIEKLVSSWQGIADIHVLGLSILDSDPELAQRTSFILEEMITNTIRHGKADFIQVQLINDSAFMKVEITHNGNGEIIKKSGLGSLLLAQRSIGDLDINTQAGMTSLQIKLSKN